MSIKIHDPKHFATVMEFALASKAADKLMKRLDYLTQYGDGTNVCHLGYDWAPNSFSFAMMRADGTLWFNGGLIYSGPTQPLDGSAPALTVGIGIDSSVHGWSIHT